MSDHSTETAVTAQDTSANAMGRWKGIGFIAMVLGIVGVGAGLSSSPETTLQGYLFGWFFWMMITLGCFGLMIFHHTIRAKWGLSLVRIFEAGGGPQALALLGLGYVPILMNLKVLYPWARPEEVEHDKIMLAKQWYLNQPAFFARFIVIFAIWILLAWILQNSSRKQDANLDDRLGVKRMSIGAVGLVIYFMTATFAVTDWIMSLEKYWYSSMLPLMNVIGGVLGAIALCIWLLLGNREKAPYSKIVNPALVKDLGNMTFALTMVWQYLMLSQYLITYAANLSEESPYYLKRNLHGWEYVVTFMVLFQFFVPFTLLLFPRMKRYASNLIPVVALVFFVRIADIYWTVLPSLRSDVKAEHAMTFLQSVANWQDWASFVLFGGAWFFVMGAQFAKAAALPKHDTRLLEVSHAH